MTVEAAANGNGGGRLWVVTYHYVRRLEGSAFPAIKGLEIDAFRAQLEGLSERFEMATIESAAALLAGRYSPKRDLCLFTFDDGLAEHYETVLPMLQEFGAQGLFGIVTSCIEDNRVATVHMNHFLTAHAGFETYSKAFLERLREEPDAPGIEQIDLEEAQRAYTLDTAEQARFKLLFNFRLAPAVREKVSRELFAQMLGSEAEFAKTLYMSWEQVRELQAGGMVVAGHTHKHEPLAAQAPEDVEADLSTSKQILDRRVKPQELWPFSYPYGRLNSFTAENVEQLQSHGFDFAFSTEHGPNRPHEDPYRLKRVDCNGVFDHVSAQN